jgi:two-component system, NtrC family, response regulator AtoC
MTETHELNKRLMIIEDEEPLRVLYEKRLKRKGYAVNSFSTAEKALKALEKETFDVALVDICMPGMSGLDFLKIAKKDYPALEIIMLTAYASIESAVQAMKHGAYDYLTKPCHLPELEMLVEKAYEKNSLRQENALLKEELRSKEMYDSLIYGSAKMKKIMSDVEKVAQSDSPVIIQGESGTGKELVAHTIHKLSPRKNGSFIAVNCANLQENLFENELFGHEKGAYTGAVEQKLGLIELAHMGTLFIDEIGEMHPSAQAKLLRVLETKRFRRVGGTKELVSDVRVIVATNENLKAAISEKKFRNDLYFRLNVISFFLPPLRDRKKDIPLLIDYFLQKKNRVLKSSKTISPKAAQLFEEYDWPGNVRELANVVERAIILSSGNCIEPHDLPFSGGEQCGTDHHSLEDMERNHIVKVLQSANGNKTLAAKILGISVRNLYRKLEQYQNRDNRKSGSSPYVQF